ncbi:MAG: pyruvate kinase [Candidatus Aminicenantes bacterium]
MPRTKIVCTIGPASRSPETLNSLIQAGMDVARLNFSHGSPSEHQEVIQAVRQLAKKLGHPVAVLQDLAGPKIRIGKIKTGATALPSGATFTLTNRPILGNEHQVSINYPHLPQDVQPGDSLLLSDGTLELEVLETSHQDIKCRVIIGGPLSSYKGINLPTRSLKLASFTEKDKNDLIFGLKQEIDYVALSFVRNPGDVLEAKRFMKKHGCEIPLIAKIEKHEALNNIEDIIAVAEGIMVARGDLGVETPLENVPSVQKSLIQTSNRAGKPVITATQMLRSMVDSPRPTRAEVTDVANAILDGTDAVMLSEETAVGKYPVKSVCMMTRIAEDAEKGFPFKAWTHRLGAEVEKNIPQAVSFAACRLAEDIRASSIITFTQSGSTAREVAKYRPHCPILAPTPEEKIFRRMALNWGVIPILSKGMRNTDDMIESTLKTALKSKQVTKGQKVVITAGVPMGVTGTTNLIKAEVVK